jgi:hypothetical protein
MMSNFTYANYNTMATATKKISPQTVGAAAAITAAAAAAAAGAYWLYGAKDAPKNRRKVKSWMLKARAEVMDAVENLSDVDKEQYLKIVDTVVRRYAGMAGAQQAEIRQLVRDLKDSWQYIARQKGPATRRARAVKGSAKRVAGKSKSKTTRRSRKK